MHFPVITTTTPELTNPSQNGVGAFILPCRRLSFHYCDWAGSSRGMNSYLSSSLLPTLLSQHPSIEIHISPRPRKHPVILAEYINGKSKAVCVRNLQPASIHEKAKLLCQNSGEKNRKIRGRNVVSENEGVRGVWSPFHGGIKNV